MEILLSCNGRCFIHSSRSRIHTAAATTRIVRVVGTTGSSIAVRIGAIRIPGTTRVTRTIAISLR